MNKFGPIDSKERFLQALDYIAENTIKLGELVLRKAMPIDTLAIFTHDDDEYNLLEPLVRQYGEQSQFTHGLTLYIDSDFEILGNRIKYLGLRRPDETRPEVGYGDFPVQDLGSLAEQYSDGEFVKLVQSGAGQAMLELRHPDFDVRAYVVVHPEVN